MEIVLKINNFEGPLDLLLQLVEKKKLKISEISISQLIDEYLDVIEKNKKENFDVKVEFIVVASELLEIKALSLLNLDSEKTKEKDLRRKLEEYKVFKEVSTKLSTMENEYNISYSRGEGKKIIRKLRDYDLTNLNSTDLYNSYAKYFNNENTTYMELNLEKRYNLKDEMDRVFLKVYSGSRTYDSLFGEAENRMHLIYIFLSILELYKDGKIILNNGEIKNNV